MEEIELKFQVPTARRAAVDAAVAGRTAPPRQRLQAAYFDTADRALARAGMALRIRREGRRTVQTLKALTGDGLTRLEHNVVLPAGVDADAVADPQRHAGTPAGERLLKLLAKAPSQPLVCLYRTDIRRRNRQLRTRQGVVELAFDEGSIVAGERRLPVCELEVELVSGSPLAVIETARGWVLRHGLWLDTRSKAERGDLLARGDAMAAPRTAGDVELRGEATLAQGSRTVFLSCLDQVAVNASQVASGPHDDEHVHQLRIGLRRLRTALRIFRGDAVPAGLSLQAAVLFRQLGAARDAAVAQPLQRALGQALAAAGLGADPPPLPAPADAVEPTQLLRQAAAQALLLDLYALTRLQPEDDARPAPAAAMPADPRAPRSPAPSDPPDAPALRDVLVRQIDRWHRQVQADAKRFTAIDDTARHTLRKRAKSLRYGIEFAAGLFKRRQVEAYLKPLRALQERLGRIVDTMVALDAYRSRRDSDPQVLFALGWLMARKEQLLREAERPMAAFGKTRRFWKG